MNVSILVAEEQQEVVKILFGRNYSNIKYTDL
jgi:hypothetical protein